MFAFYRNTLNKFQLYYYTRKFHKQLTPNKLTTHSLIGLLNTIYLHDHDNTQHMTSVSRYVLLISKTTLEKRVLVLIKTVKSTLKEPEKQYIIRILLTVYNLQLFHIFTMHTLSSKLVLSDINKLLIKEPKIHAILISCGLTKYDINIFYMYSELMLNLIVGANDRSQLIEVINTCIRMRKEIRIILK